MKIVSQRNWKISKNQQRERNTPSRQCQFQIHHDHFDVASPTNVYVWNKKTEQLNLVLMREEVCNGKYRRRISELSAEVAKLDGKVRELTHTVTDMENNHALVKERAVLDAIQQMSRHVNLVKSFIEEHRTNELHNYMTREAQHLEQTEELIRQTFSNNKMNAFMDELQATNEKLRKENEMMRVQLVEVRVDNKMKETQMTKMSRIIAQFSATNTVPLSGDMLKSMFSNVRQCKLDFENLREEMLSLKNECGRVFITKIDNALDGFEKTAEMVQIDELKWTLAEKEEEIRKLQTETQMSEEFQRSLKEIRSAHEKLLETMNSAVNLSDSGNSRLPPIQTDDTNPEMLSVTDLLTNFEKTVVDCARRLTNRCLGMQLTIDEHVRTRTETEQSLKILEEKLVQVEQFNQDKIMLEETLNLKIADLEQQNRDAQETIEKLQKTEVVGPLRRSSRAPTPLDFNIPTTNNSNSRPASSFFATQLMNSAFEGSIPMPKRTQSPESGCIGTDVEVVIPIRREHNTNQIEEMKSALENAQLEITSQNETISYLSGELHRTKEKLLHIEKEKPIRSPKAEIIVKEYHDEGAERLDNLLALPESPSVIIRRENSIRKEPSISPRINRVKNEKKHPEKEKEKEKEKEPEKKIVEVVIKFDQSCQTDPKVCVETSSQTIAGRNEMIIVVDPSALNGGPVDEKQILENAKIQAQKRHVQEAVNATIDKVRGPKMEMIPKSGVRCQGKSSAVFRNSPVRDLLGVKGTSEGGSHEPPQTVTITSAEQRQRWSNALGAQDNETGMYTQDDFNIGSAHKMFGVTNFARQNTMVSPQRRKYTTTSEHVEQSGTVVVLDDNVELLSKKRTTTGTVVKGALVATRLNKVAQKQQQQQLAAQQEKPVDVQKLVTASLQSSGQVSPRDNTRTNSPVPQVTEKSPSVPEAKTRPSDNKPAKSESAKPSNQLSKTEIVNSKVLQSAGIRDKRRSSVDASKLAAKLETTTEKKTTVVVTNENPSATEQDASNNLPDPVKDNPNLHTPPKVTSATLAEPPHSTGTIPDPHLLPSTTTKSPRQDNSDEELGMPKNTFILKREDFIPSPEIMKTQARAVELLVKRDRATEVQARTLPAVKDTKDLEQSQSNNSVVLPPIPSAKETVQPDVRPKNRSLWESSVKMNLK
eukprot:PhF_6_TR44277/c0_g1_i1/m.68224